MGGGTRFCTHACSSSKVSPDLLYRAAGRTPVHETADAERVEVKKELLAGVRVVLPFTNEVWERVVDQTLDR